MVEADSDTETGSGRYHRSANGRLIGLLLIGLGVVWFLSEIGGLSGETMRATVLILLGAGLIYSARRDRGGGRSLWPIILGVILTFTLLGSAGSGFRSVRAEPGPGDSSVIVPQSADDLESDYPGGVTRMILDLRQVPSTDLDRPITIDNPVADLRVAVPPGVDVVVDSIAGVGRLTVCGQRVDGGLPLGQSYASRPGAAAPQLLLHISGGAGEVQVTCDGSPTPPDPATPPNPPAPPIPTSVGG